MRNALSYAGTAVAGLLLALVAAIGLPVVFADDPQQSEEPVVLYGER